MILGTENPNAFFRRTRGDWERLARYLLRKWPPPAAVDESDLVQQLQFEALRALPKYNAARCGDPDKYLIFSAITRTKRWLHRQRGARRGSAIPEAYMVSESDLGEAERQHIEPSVEADQHAELERDGELKRLLTECASIQTAVCLVAVHRHRDVALAGQAIYDDPTLRRICRLDCRDDARRVVSREIRRASSKVTPWLSS